MKIRGRFVFTKLFYVLFALALIPLSFSWERPSLRWVAFTYDVLLLGVAVAESRFCRLPRGVTIWREFGSRFAVKLPFPLRWMLLRP